MESFSKKVVIALAVMTPIIFTQPLLAATDEASKPTEAGASSGMGMMPMRRQMERMHEEMTKLHETKDPEARRALMGQHATSMQDMMKMMHGMMEGQMMMHNQPGGTGDAMRGPKGAPDARHGHGRGKESGGGAMAPGARAMMGRMGMMEKRMNVMQMMMDQMLQHQKLMLEK